MSFRMTLTGMDAIEYPELPEGDGERFAIPQNLLEMPFGWQLSPQTINSFISSIHFPCPLERDVRLFILIT
jgi:hypothetical protein